MAELAEKSGDADARRFAVERVVTVDPFDAAAHTALGGFAMERRDLPLALRAFRVALAAGSTDVGSSHCDLAEALLASGNRADAKREVLTALEMAPTYPRAQDLLLKIIEG
jgi:cellulose synthase operon protein C